MTGRGREKRFLQSALSRVGVPFSGRTRPSYDSIASIQEERRGAGAGGKILESKTEELNFHRRGAARPDVCKPHSDERRDPLPLLTLRPLKETCTRGPREMHACTPVRERARYTRVRVISDGSPSAIRGNAARIGDETHEERSKSGALAIFLSFFLSSLG